MDHYNRGNCLLFCRIMCQNKGFSVKEHLTVQSENSALTWLAMSKSNRPRISLDWHFCHLLQDKCIGRVVLKSFKVHFESYTINRMNLPQSFHKGFYRIIFSCVLNLVFLICTKALFPVSPIHV